MVTTARRAEPTKVPATADPAWVKALFLAPAVLGSFCTLVLLGRSTGVRHGLRRWLGRPADAVRGDAVRGVDAATLRGSIVGQSKRRVTALFGPPPAATSAPTVTWYYPVPAARRTAMAVSFDGDRATGVEFSQSPG